nr:hypothetical protein GCM10025699_45170 [Microbacterium flavescens]
MLSRRYRLATLGMCALIAIAAFESLAVTTIMPIISAELDGESLYSLSFAAPSPPASSAWSWRATGPIGAARGSS